MVGDGAPGHPPRAFGVERGKVFPASEAAMLERRARRVVQSPPALARWLRLEPGARVLELGCGPGFFSAALARRVPAGALVLCDLQPEMLRLAARKLDTAALPRAGAVAADALALPYRRASFDVVFVAAVLGEVPQPVGCIAEAARVLRPSGTLAITEVRGDDDYIGFDRLRALVEPAGFTLARRRRGLWSYTAAFSPREAARS